MRRHRNVLLLLLIALLISGAGITIFVLFPEEANTVSGNDTALTIGQSPANSPEPLTGEPAPASRNDTPRPEAPQAPEEPATEPLRDPAGPVTQGYAEPVEVEYETSAPGPGHEVLMFGVVVDQDDVPVPSAVIVLYVTHESDKSGFSAQVVGESDRDGRFSLRVLHRRCSGTTYRYAVSAGKDGFTQSTILMPDPDNPVTLRLKRCSDRTTVEGEVLDDAGNPITARKVWCRATSPMFDPQSFARLPEDLQEILRPGATITWMTDAWADQYGRFSLEVKRPGMVTVWAGSDSFDKAGDSVELEAADGAVNLLPRPLTLREK